MGGGGATRQHRFLLAGVKAWHAQAEAAEGHMSAVATGVRTALLQAKMEVEVGTLAPDLGRVEQAHVQVVERLPFPQGFLHTQWGAVAGHGRRSRSIW